MKLFTFFFLSIFFIISLFIGEFYLKHIGLGNPISYDSDLTYGYAPKVNQKKNRLKSSTVTINEVGLRSLDNHLIGVMGISYTKEHNVLNAEWDYIRNKSGVIGTLLSKYLYKTNNK